MTWSLEPTADMARIVIGVNAECRWSLLVPETICCREGGVMHTHIRGADWTRTPTGWVVHQTFPDERWRSECRLDPVDDGTVELVVIVSNDGPTPMTDAEADFCFACALSPWNTLADDVACSWVNRPFHGARREFNTDWTRRTLVPTGAGLRVVGDINTHFPVPPNRLVRGQNVADFPIILCQSEDRTEVYAAGWEQCTRLFCAIGSCIHTVVGLGTIAPGATAQRRGRFYYRRSDPYTVLARFQRDFGYGAALTQAR